jgi:phage protein U
MQNVLMSLGLFVFSTRSAPFESVERITRWNHAKKARFGQYDSSQYTGPGDDKITINGSIAPTIAGSPKNLLTLVKMAQSGKAWTMISGLGTPMGNWKILELKETRKHLLDDGQARLIEFTLQLEYYPDGDFLELGNLEDSIDTILDQIR